jgi:catechol 2,3-dioxygenase-like lactoylglutathione lyase family enzyme
MTRGETMERAALVPELVTSDFENSLRFYVAVLGFEVKYRRENPLFAYLEREHAQIMLEVRQHDSWVLGELSAPFGRGMNLMIECSDVKGLRERLATAGIPVFLELEDAWYDTGRTLTGLRQFIVADPDGYLLRFGQRLGERERA